MSCPSGSADARAAQPSARRFHICQRLERRERLRRDDDQRGRRVEQLHRVIECRAVDVRQETNHQVGRARPSASTRSCRPKHRAADPDVEDPGERAESSGLDRVDERAHSLTPGHGEIDLGGCTAAAFGDVSGWTTFADIDDLAGKQSVAGGARSPCALPVPGIARQAAGRGVSCSSRNRCPPRRKSGGSGGLARHRRAASAWSRRSAVVRPWSAHIVERPANATPA